MKFNLFITVFLSVSRLFSLLSLLLFCMVFLHILFVQYFIFQLLIIDSFKICNNGKWYTKILNSYRDIHNNNNSLIFFQNANQLLGSVSGSELAARNSLHLVVKGKEPSVPIARFQFSAILRILYSFCHMIVSKIKHSPLTKTAFTFRLDCY